MINKVSKIWLILLVCCLNLESSNLRRSTSDPYIMADYKSKLACFPEYVGCYLELIKIPILDNENKQDEVCTDHCLLNEIRSFISNPKASTSGMSKVLNELLDKPAPSIEDLCLIRDVYDKILDIRSNAMSQDDRYLERLWVDEVSCFIGRTSPTKSDIELLYNTAMQKIHRVLVNEEYDTLKLSLAAMQVLTTTYSKILPKRVEADTWWAELHALISATDEVSHTKAAINIFFGIIAWKIIQDIKDEGLDKQQPTIEDLATKMNLYSKILSFGINPMEQDQIYLKIARFIASFAYGDTIKTLYNFMVDKIQEKVQAITSPKQTPTNEDLRAVITAYSSLIDETDQVNLAELSLSMDSLVKEATTDRPTKILYDFMVSKVQAKVQNEHFVQLEPTARNLEAVLTAYHKLLDESEQEELAQTCVELHSLLYQSEVGEAIQTLHDFVLDAIRKKVKDTTFAKPDPTMDDLKEAVGAYSIILDDKMLRLKEEFSKMYSAKTELEVAQLDFNYSDPIQLSLCRVLFTRVARIVKANKHLLRWPTGRLL